MSSALRYRFAAVGGGAAAAAGCSLHVQHCHYQAVHHGACTKTLKYCLLLLLLQAVPYTFSIATVKRYIWKRSDDVIFNYRILDPSRLAPFPPIGTET